MVKINYRLIGIIPSKLTKQIVSNLVLDFQDYLRQRGVPLWTKDTPEAQKIRQIAYEKNKSYTTYKTYIEEKEADVAANTIICMIHQTNYLLDQQLRALEKDFLKEGGFTEKLYRVRSQYRANKRI